MLRVLLFAQLFYVVNQVHFSRIDSAIPGVAPANLLFALTLAFMVGKPDAVSERGMLSRALLWFFGGLTFAFVWSQVRAPGDFVADLTHYKNALFYPLFYFVYRRCRQDEKTTRTLIIWVMVIAALAGAEAIREGLDYGFDRFSPMRRASGPFGTDWHNANRAGVFYAMFMPMFVALALFLRRRKLWRVAAIGGCALLAGGALFTYSRQAYALVLLAAAVLLLRRSVVLATIVAVAFVASAGYLPESAFQRVESTKQQGSAGEEQVDESTASRWELWAGGLQMWKENPLGVGLRRFPSEIGNYSSYKKMDAHNFYVLMLAEGSVITLVPWLCLIATLLKLSGWLRRHADPTDTEATALATGFTVSTICMALGGIYGSPNLEGSVMAPYWALAGLLERYFVLRQQAREPTGGDEMDSSSMLERFPLAAYLPHTRNLGSKARQA